MSLDGLSLEAQQVLDTYLLQLSNRLHHALLEVGDCVVNTLENQVYEQLAEKATIPELKTLLANLGDPELQASRIANWLWSVYLQQQENGELLKVQ
jgi:uncharacterized iron-regulated protein